MSDEKPCRKRMCRLVAEHVATLEATMLQWKARAIEAESKLPSAPNIQGDAK